METTNSDSVLTEEITRLEGENDHLVGTVNVLLAERKRLAMLVTEKKENFEKEMGNIVSRRAISIVSSNPAVVNNLNLAQYQRKNSVNEELRDAQLVRLSEDLEKEKGKRIKTKQMCEMVLDLLCQPKGGSKQALSIDTLVEAAQSLNRASIDVDCKNSENKTIESKLEDISPVASNKGKISDSMRHVVLQQEQEIVSLTCALKASESETLKLRGELEEFQKRNNKLDNQVSTLEESLKEEQERFIQSNSRALELTQRVGVLSQERVQLQTSILEKNKLLEKAMREFSVVPAVTAALGGEVMAAAHHQSEQENRQLAQENHKLRLELGRSSAREAGLKGHLQQLLSAVSMMKLGIREMKCDISLFKARVASETDDAVTRIQELFGGRADKSFLVSGSSSVPEEDSLPQPPAMEVQKAESAVKTLVEEGEECASEEISKEHFRSRHRRSATVGSPMVDSLTWSRRIEPRTRNRAATVGLDKAMAAIRRNPLFSNLSTEEVNSVLNACVQENWRAGETISAKGLLEGGCVRFIIQGRVGIETSTKGLTFRGAGAMIGGFAGSEAEKKLISVVAVEPVRSLRLDNKKYTELRNKHGLGSIAYSLTKIASEIGLELLE